MTLSLLNLHETGNDSLSLSSLILIIFTSPLSFTITLISHSSY